MEWPKEVVFVPIGYQGPAQHTYTLNCDGSHEPGQCKQSEIQYFTLETK